MSLDVSALTTVFVEHFGHEPEGVWSAPGRVNLIGEHTDYNGGLALPIAIPQRTYAAAARRDDGHLRMHSVQTGVTVEIALDQVAPGSPPGWAAYVAGVAWALGAAGYPVGGADLLLDGQVPLGAGLSSSAAIECATAAALSDLYRLRDAAGRPLLDSPSGRAELVDASRRAENEIAGAPTGGMDQSASMLATTGHALLLDCQDGATEQVPFDLESANLTLLVIDTRAEHALVDGQYGARRRSCERAADALGVATLREIEPEALDAAVERLQTTLTRHHDSTGQHLGEEEPEVVADRVRHVVREIARVQAATSALRAGDWVGLGQLFSASHASLRDQYQVSCEELDLACATAEDQGALGARMTGGGFGGSAIALLPKDRAQAAADTVTAAFADAGYHSPDIFAVHASPGASRDLTA